MAVGCVVLVPAERTSDEVPAAARAEQQVAAALAERLAAAHTGSSTPVLVRPEPGAAGPAARWGTRVAAALQRSLAPTSGAVLLVGLGPAGTLLPDLGRAVRAARRPLAGYVLVDSPLPIPAPDATAAGSTAGTTGPGAAGPVDWPDAPLTLVLGPDADDDCRSAARQARLRGWSVVTSDDVAAAVAGLAVRD